MPQFVWIRCFACASRRLLTEELLFTFAFKRGIPVNKVCASLQADSRGLACDRCNSKKVWIEQTSSTFYVPRPDAAPARRSASPAMDRISSKWDAATGSPGVSMQEQTLGERAPQMKTCPSCGGDGGYNNNCFRCGGTGWLDQRPS